MKTQPEIQPKNKSRIAKEEVKQKYRLAVLEGGLFRQGCRKEADGIDGFR